MKKIMKLSVFLFSVGVVHAQTDTQNYLYTKNCLDADCIKKTEVVQYFDGLGRPFQTIDIKGTPLKKDMVSYVEYDQYGRQSKSYLPVPQTGTQNGLVYENPLSNAPASYGSEKIFSEQIIENSPLERVKQSFGTGTEWSNKPVTYDYSTNSSATEVKKYTVTTDWVNSRTETPLSDSGFYAVNTLTKTSVTDEDGNTVTEYKNGKGQTILVKKNDGTNDIKTYYVYNKYDQLAYVIPPLASVISNLSTNDISTLCYQYRYDGWGRLVEKKLPGKDWEYMVYDKSDRLILSQDGSLRLQNRWLITKYDRLGRVAYTGFLTTGGSRAARQNEIQNLVITESRNTTGFTRNGMLVYYTDGYFSNEVTTVLNVNYYDTYPNGSPAVPAQILGKAVLQDNAALAINTRTLPTASYVKNIENDGWTKDYIWYDMKGRAIGSHSDNHLGGYTKTESLLDFAGVVQNSVLKHKRASIDTEKVISETFEYDDQNRLLVHKHQVDSNPVEILSQNSYNELSQLAGKKVGGTSVGSPLESISYTYNIKGWLTKINDPKNLGSKLFGYEIKYNNVEGQETPNLEFSDLKVKPRYNGNIAEVDWKTATTPNDNLRRYGYVYDKLNRLSAGFYQKDDNPSAQEYYEKMDYDVNGNILHLKRTAEKGGETVAKAIDKLTYSYTGNRLTSVSDSSENYRGYPDTSGTPISYYEESGNMKDHIDKGILHIDYNFLNLPKYIKFNEFVTGRGGPTYVNSTYSYRADGTKIGKVYMYKDPLISNTLSSTSTDYLDGFQYEAISGGTGSTSAALQFFPTAEGYYNFENNKYIYSYTDHLGNVRLSYFKNANGSAEVLEENNYYPFGMKHEGYNPLSGNPAYKYQFGGKELQKETGWNDFGARMYMFDIGRWGVVDPMAEAEASWTPYRYGFNNPIMFSDPTGMIEQNDINNMLNTGGSYNYSNGNLNYLGGGNLGGNYLTDDRFREGYYTPAADFLDYIDIPELVMSAPKSYKGNSALIGLTLGMAIPRHLAAYLGYKQEPYVYRGPENGQGGGLYMMSGDMFGLTDLLGLAFSSMEPENRESAIGLAAVAIILTKGRAAPAILKTELTIERAEIKSMVNLTEETFSQALMSGAENVAGYSIYGTKGLVGNTFNRNIFLLEASGSKSLSGFRSLVGSMEKEALRTGANKISIYGSSVINKGFLNPNIATRFGYNFEQSGSGVILQKALK